MSARPCHVAWTEDIGFHAGECCVNRRDKIFLLLVCSKAASHGDVHLGDAMCTDSLGMHCVAKQGAETVRPRVVLRAGSFVHRGCAGFRRAGGCEDTVPLIGIFARLYSTGSAVQIKVGWAGTLCDVCSNRQRQ